LKYIAGRWVDVEFMKDIQQQPLFGGDRDGK